jgi:hypothetical protein
LSSLLCRCCQRRLFVALDLLIAQLLKRLSLIAQFNFQRTTYKTTPSDGTKKPRAVYYQRLLSSLLTQASGFTTGSLGRVVACSSNLLRCGSANGARRY